MRFLLIDFGASFVKSAIYDSESGSICEPRVVPSPFSTKDRLHKDEVQDVINGALNRHVTFSEVVMCSILEGYYVDVIYYSWKCNNKPPKPDNDTCLLSELFKGQPSFHIHANHSKQSTVTGLELLGMIDNKRFYSSLGDTNCVMASVDLSGSEVLVNMGTGSQIIRLDSLGRYDITSFIPSGRALSLFNEFMASFGVDLFLEFGHLKLADLNSSTLVFDLNVFPQAYRYKDGGAISNIQEKNFTKTNFISSLFRSYVDQYTGILNLRPATRIYLAGGISKKYPLIREYIQYETKIETLIQSSQYEDTHVGMKNLILKYLTIK